VGIGVNLKKDSIVIVGSRCGGFDYFAKKRGDEQYIWLGCSENSDIDFYASFEERNFQSPFLQDVRNICYFRIPNILYGHEFPFKLDGILHEPEDKTYLCWAIKRKMALNLKNNLKTTGSLFDIYNPNKKFVTTISYKPIIP